MKKIKMYIHHKTLSIIFALLILLSGYLSVSTKKVVAATNGSVYSFSTLQFCEDGSGYCNGKNLPIGDPLVGVKVAEINISDFSSSMVKNGKRYFLKTTPDVPKLSIMIKTDLNNLGGSGSWINSDGDMRIPEFGFAGNEIGYGWFGIEYTNYQGRVQSYCTNHIFKKIESTTSTPAWFGQEGAYKIALCFEVKRQTGTYKNWHNPFYYTNDPTYGYTNYRIDAQFEIRNANTQVFLFDTAGNELLNGAVCDGFTLDYANSHYLQISVKREIAISSNDLMESTDIRFNSVGVDKRKYSTPGIYTIQAYNNITGATTVKRVLVRDLEDSMETKALMSAARNAYPEFKNGNIAITITIIFCAVCLIGGMVVTVFYIKRKMDN